MCRRSLCEAGSLIWEKTDTALAAASLAQEPGQRQTPRKGMCAGAGLRSPSSNKPILVRDGDLLAAEHQLSQRGDPGKPGGPKQIADATKAVQKRSILRPRVTSTTLSEMP